MSEISALVLMVDANVPGLAQLDVGDSMIVSKGEVDVSVGF